MMLSPCPGCGALFPAHDGPTHRYLGASAGCWALASWSVFTGSADAMGILEQSRIPQGPTPPSHPPSTVSLDSMAGDAYAVQHHGEDSPQAIQSVAIHFLNLHGIISGQTTKPGWVLTRALRTRGVFHKLEPPALGSALTIRHLFPGGGVVTPVTRGQYAQSVYDAWIARHRSTVERWYEAYVARE